MTGRKLGGAGGTALWRPLAALTVALVLPLAARILLHSRLAILWTLLPPGLVVGARIAERLLQPRGARWMSRLAGRFGSAAVFTFAAFLLIGIVITPYSAYRLWFDSVQMGTPQGAVSSIFVLATAFFSSLLSPALLSMGVPWTLAVLGLTVLYLLGMIFPSPLLFLLILALMAACLYLLAAAPAADRPAPPAGAAERAGRLGAAGRDIARIGAFFPLLLLAGALGLAFLFAGDRQPQGSRLIDQTVYPYMRDLVISLFPEFPLIYDIPGYGYSFNEKKLGGRPILSNNPIFEVEGDPGETLYLRTRVFDYYDGRSWKIDIGEFDRNLYRAARWLFAGRAVSPHNLRITLAVDFYNNLPHTLDTYQIRFGRSEPEYRQGNIGMGYRLEPPLKNGDTILLAHGEPAGFSSPVETNTPLLWQAPSSPQAFRQDLKRLSYYQRMHYLQIPDTLPVEVRALAAQLAGGRKDPRQILQSIQRYLAANYSYSLSPREPRDPSDFVAGFLFGGGGSGYCVHFASSLIILARLNGIPARYATGFLAYIPETSYRTVVTGMAAHAWPEVWLEDQGWVTWEATTAVNPQFYSRDAGELIYRYHIEQDSLTARQLESLLGEPVAEDTAAGAEGQAAAGAAGAAWKAPPGAPLLGAAALLVLLAGLRYRDTLRALLPIGRSALEYRLSWTLRRLRRRGLPDPSVCGWVAWFRELENRLPASREQIQSLRRALLRRAYAGAGTAGGRPPQALPSDSAADLLQRIEQLGRMLPPARD